MHVEYDPYVIPVAQVGDILYSDMTYKAAVDSSKTPIAICVAPASHFQDGKARWMSLVNMSLADPEHGTTATGNNASNPGAGIAWGAMDIVGVNNDILPKQMKVSDNAVTEGNPMGFLNELSDDTTMYPIRDYDNGIADNIYPFNTNGFGLGTVLSAGVDDKKNSFMPYQFNQDGSLNDLFISAINGSACEDMRGYMLTKSIIEAATSTEAEGAITNDYSSGHFPAAMACHRFTAGIPSLAGQWYLPTIGELSYVIASITKINQKLVSLGNSAVGIGVLDGWTGTTDTTGSLGSRLLSSSGYSARDAWYLNMSTGTISWDDKRSAEDFGTLYPTYGIRIRAFLAL